MAVGIGGANRMGTVALDSLDVPETTVPHASPLAPGSGGLPRLHDRTRGPEARQRAKLEKQLAREQKLASSADASADHVDGHGELDGTRNHKPAVDEKLVVKNPDGTYFYAKETEKHEISHNAHHGQPADTVIIPPEKQGKVNEECVDTEHGASRPEGKPGHDTGESVHERIGDLRKETLEALANEKDPARRAELTGVLDKLDKLASQVKPSSVPHSGEGRPNTGHPGTGHPGAGGGIVPFSDLEKMSPNELAAFQASQTYTGMAIQIFMAQVEMLSEIVKKGSNAASQAIG